MVAGLGKPSMVGIGMVAVICDTAAAALPAVRKENTNAWITEPPRRPLTQDDLDRLERARLKRERKAARKAANR